jgi:hypothetical protein
MKTHTFEEKDKKFLLTIKTEFLNQCPDPENYTLWDLLVKFKMNRYLHNSEGPAVVRLKDNFLQYWEQGQFITDTNLLKREGK